MNTNRDFQYETLYQQEEFYDYELISKRQKRDGNGIGSDLDNQQQQAMDYEGVHMQNQNVMNVLEYLNYEADNLHNYQFLDLVQNDKYKGTINDYDSDVNYFDNLFTFDNRGIIVERQQSDFHDLNVQISEKYSFRKQRSFMNVDKISQYDSQNRMIHEESFNKSIDWLFQDNYYILKYVGRIRSTDQFEELSARSSNNSESLATSDFSLTQSDLQSSSFSSFSDDDNDSDYTLKRYYSLPNSNKMQALLIQKKIRKRWFTLQPRSQKTQQQSNNNTKINESGNIEQNLIRQIKNYLINQINDRCYQRSTANKSSCVLGTLLKQKRKLQQSLFYMESYAQSGCNPRVKEQAKRHVLELIIHSYFNAKESDLNPAIPFISSSQQHSTFYQNNNNNNKFVSIANELLK